MLDAPPPTLFVALVALLAGGLTVWVFRRWWQMRRWRRRRQRARRGEVQAIPLLETAGYRVIAEQRSQVCRVIVDGRPTEYVVRADLLVTRGNETFVAEVKTGKRAPDPTHTPTRRQLLEYFVAYPADGVLLVDVEGGQIRRVAWELGHGGPALTKPRPSRRIAIALFLLSLGLLAGWWLRGNVS